MESGGHRRLIRPGGRVSPNGGGSPDGEPTASGRTALTPAGEPPVVASLPSVRTQTRGGACLWSARASPSPLSIVPSPPSKRRPVTDPGAVVSMPTVVDPIDPLLLVAILFAAVAVVLLAVLATGKRRARTAALAERFGDEYGRAVGRARSRRRAEEELSRRVEERRGYTPRPLDAEERDAFQGRWDALQPRFVDGPAVAARAAFELVTEVAVTRGYPSDATDRCLDGISVDHPELVADLRRSWAGSREWATTEHHRASFVHARALFDRLLADGAPPDPTVACPPAPALSADAAADAGGEEPRGRLADPAV